MENTPILIVEDNKALSENIAEHLELLGYMPVPVYNADQARRAVLERSPQLVLLDINLGSGEDGISLARYFRGIELPFIFMTAAAIENSDKHREAIRSNPFGFLNKPFKMIDLSTQIELALNNFAQRMAKVEPFDHELQHSITFRDAQGFNVVLRIEEILFFESRQRRAFVCLKDGRELALVNSLSEIAQRLARWNFAKASRAMLVNIYNVESFNRARFQTTGGRQFEVGRQFRDEFYNALSLRAKILK